MASQNVKVSVQLRKDKDNMYSAWIEVHGAGQATWTGGVYGKKTPLAALTGIRERIDEDLNPSKRGRKPRGYDSLVLLRYGWEE